MTGWVAFSAGAIVAFVGTFVAFHAFVWLPIYEDLRGKYRIERSRRIEAEDNAAHAALGAPTRAAWGPSVLPYVETHPQDSGPQIRLQEARAAIESAFIVQEVERGSIFDTSRTREVGTNVPVIRIEDQGDY